MNLLDSLKNTQKLSVATTSVADVPPVATVGQNKISESQKSNVSLPVVINATSLRDEFVKVKKSNGLFEKFYDFCKNKTSLGLGSKKIESLLAAYEQGKISAENVKNELSKYGVSQENAAQNFGDFLSASVVIPTYFFGSNQLKKIAARIELDAMQKFTSRIDKCIKFAAKSRTIVLIPVLAILGGFTKLFALKLNRIGSKEFKLENSESMDKKELKKAKKELRREKRKANFKNFVTGAINGVLAPACGIVGGLVGVPAYLLALSGIRYGMSKNDDNDKSFKDYTQVLKNNAVLNSVFALGIAAPAFMRARYSSILSKNLEKVVTKLKNVTLSTNMVGETSYEKIRNIMIGSNPIQSILNNRALTDPQKVAQLIDENIFAAKFMQIASESDFSNLGMEIGDVSKLISALKQDCPTSRTIEEATSEINMLLGEGKYNVTKLLGVGTIAESYLAKDVSGKEVCIKILKKGMDATKITTDKEKFIKLIVGNTPVDKLSDEQKYLLKNVENLAEAIAKETDFIHEAEAAKKLSKYTKKANVVVPIESKNGIYVMEKAPGISLQTLVDYFYETSLLKYLKQSKYSSDKYEQRLIKECEEKIAKLKAKAPDFADFNLSSNEINRLLRKYIEITTEQFTKVDKHGKTLHADIHPGNIFINLEALKSNKGQLFTLIDTGNTIDLAREQALAAIKLTSFVKSANVEDLAKYITEGVILPPNLTKETLVELVENDFRTLFFDSKTKINNMTNEELFRLGDNILRKHNVIPNNTQLNLSKAKVSARKSFKHLIDSFFNQKYGNIDSKMDVAAAMPKILWDGSRVAEKFVREQKMQEYKNMAAMPLKDALAYLRNPNNLKGSSEDYLTYIMKQYMQNKNNDTFF